MNEIAASERRLSAALDRIDQLLEAVPGQTAPADGSDLQAELNAAKAENQRLLAEINSLQDSPPAASGMQTPATDAAEQLTRLAAANEELIAANRALLDATESNDVIETIRKACDAEVEALRAARFAEIANLAEIMGELDRLLGQEKAAAKPAREKPASQANQTSFSGIYGDAPDKDEEEGK